MRPSDAHPTSTMLDHDFRMGQPPVPAHTTQPSNYNPNQSFPAQFASPHRTDAFSMGNIGAALPEVQYPNYNNSAEQQRQQGHTASNYQMPNMSQFGGQQAQNSPIANMPYSLPYQNQFHGMYPAHHVSLPHVQTAANSAPQFFQSPGYIGQLQQQIPPYFVPSGQYGHHGPQVYLSGAAQTGVRGAIADGRQLSPQVTEFSGGPPRVGGQGRPGSVGMLERLLPHA
jgi:hypothetical protein